MSDSSSEPQLSPLDEQRFGVRTARADRVTRDRVDALLAFCRKERVGLALARVPAEDLAAAQALEAAGFRLMDTLVWYARRLESAPGPASVRPVRPGESDAVRRIAEDSFRGYFGHYHADPRLDRAACDAVYASWAARSVAEPGVADAVLVAEREAALAGFATLKWSSPEEGEGVLFGVAPPFQGRGVYREMMEAAMAWFAARGGRRMVVSTQIANLAVQKVWSRLGFEPSRFVHTFHGWF